MFQLTPIRETRAGQEILEYGREEGQKVMLLRQLKARFGDIPEIARVRLETIHDPQRLGDLAERLFFARTLTDLDLV